MRLIDADEAIKAIDNHTREDGTLDDDISCIIDEVPTVAGGALREMPRSKEGKYMREREIFFKG